MSVKSHIFVIATLLTALAGCTTQYERYSRVDMQGMTLNQAQEYLDGLEIRYRFASCDEAANRSSNPLSHCQFASSIGILKALANDGSYMFGAGSSDMRLFIELGPDQTVVEVREDVFYTFL